MKKIKVIFLIVGFLSVISCGQTFYISNQRYKIVGDTSDFQKIDINKVKTDFRLEHACWDKTNGLRFFQSIILIGFFIPDSLYNKNFGEVLFCR